MVERTDPIRGDNPFEYPSSESERAELEPALGRQNFDATTNEDIGDDPAEIRDNIERTRADMSETIDAIQDRLNPQTLADQAKDAVRDATVGRVEHAFTSATDTARETGSTMVDRIKENPVPVALAGIGLGWWFFGRNNEPGYDTQRYQSAPSYTGSAPYARSTYGTRSYVAGTGERHGGSGQEWRGQSSGGGFTGMVKENPIPFALAGLGLGMLLSKGMGSSDVKTIDHIGPDLSRRGLQGSGSISHESGHGQMGETVGRIQGKADETWNQTKGQASDLADDMSHRVDDLTNQAQYQAQRAQGQFQSMLQENPLILGAVALGLGAAIGFAVPETQKEAQVMGEARDSLVDKAQGMAQEKLETAKEVVSETKDAAQEAAQEQGLMG